MSKREERALAEAVADVLRPMEDVTLDDAGGLVRRVIVVPGYDCWDRCAHGKATCRRGTGGWHGIGSTRVVFVVALRGRGAASFDLHAPIYPDSVITRSPDVIDLWHPLGALDLHYATPPDYLTDYGPKDCDYIGGDCWTDFTFTQGEACVEALLKDGAKGVWAWLGEAWLPQTIDLSDSR